MNEIKTKNERDIANGRYEFNEKSRNKEDLKTLFYIPIQVCNIFVDARKCLVKTSQNFYIVFSKLLIQVLQFLEKQLKIH